MTKGGLYPSGNKRKKSHFWQGFSSGLAVGFIVSFNLLLLLRFRDLDHTTATAVAIDNHGVSAWKQIHVYVGDASPEKIAEASTIRNDYFSATRWFSQVRQDEVVSRLLYGKRNGYFVDLAANDAVRISNTYALERYFDWNGLAIEPNPVYWEGLAYRKCQVVAAVVGKQGEDHIFRFPKDKAPKGGLVGSDFDNKEVTKKNPDEYRTKTTVTILEIFQRFGTPSVIDYLSLDVEGAEQLVMEGFPFDRYRFNVMTIERPSDGLRQLLATVGYKQLKELKGWGETLWVHEAIEPSIDPSALEMDTEHYSYKEKPRE